MKTFARNPFAVALMSLVVTTAGAFGAVETQDQLQTLFDGGHYQELLPKLNQAIALKGPAAAGYDRYKLLILKGETQLRLPSGKSAMDSFKAAALIAPSPDDGSIAHATALLINRSSAGKFLAKKTESNKTPTAIAIVESSDRKQAFEALFTELMDEAKPQLDQAEQITALPPLMDVAKKLGDIRPVEIAASGKDDLSKESLKVVAKHAETLMNDALKKIDTRVSEIEKAASKKDRSSYRVKGPSGTNNSSSQQGLTADNISELQSIATEAKQIAQAAVQMQTTFGDAGDFKGIESTSNKTFQRANEILKKADRPTVS